MFHALPKNPMMGSPLASVHHYMVPRPMATGAEREEMSRTGQIPDRLKQPPHTQLRLLFGEWFWVYTQHRNAKRLRQAN